MPGRAILPFVVAPESHGWVGAVVGIVAFAVLLIGSLVAYYAEHPVSSGEDVGARLT